MSAGWTTPAGLHVHQSALPVEGRLGSFDGATEWLNSEALTAAGLDGSVALVNFWTYTCVNWLRQLPYLRAWADRYGEHGLVLVGVHTPEFSFEHDTDNIRRAVAADDIRYPVAVDSAYAVWEAFGNHYWPALYFADAQGRIRHHHYGEGEYEQAEMVIQQLLAEAGADSGPDRVAVQPRGLEVPADWGVLRTPESYTGYRRAETFASPEGVRPGKPQTYTLPRELWLNEWALDGEWTIDAEPATLGSAGGRVAFTFHARDLNLVMGPATKGVSTPYQVLLDGQPPGHSAGNDVSADGTGTLTQQRLHQLLRQEGPIRDRTATITFTEPAAQIFCFTFG
jgi:hypothetical protein